MICSKRQYLEVFIIVRIENNFMTITNCFAELLKDRKLCESIGMTKYGLWRFRQRMKKNEPVKDSTMTLYLTLAGYVKIKDAEWGKS